jgi:chromosome segregation ATPase
MFSSLNSGSGLIGRLVSFNRWLTGGCPVVQFADTAEAGRGPAPADTAPVEEKLAYYQARAAYYEKEGKAAFQVRDTVKQEAEALKLQVVDLTKTADQAKTAQATLAELTAKFTASEQALAALTAEKTAAVAKIAELEPKATTLAEMTTVLDGIVAAQLESVPERYRPLVKGTTPVEKMASYQELLAAGLFKIENPGQKLPGAGAAKTMTLAEFNALPQADVPAVQSLLNKGQLKLVP